MSDFTSLELNRVGPIVFDTDPLQLHFENRADHLTALLISCAWQRTTILLVEARRDTSDLDWMHASG